jgi:hypothetical protein
VTGLNDYRSGTCPDCDDAADAVVPPVGPGSDDVADSWNTEMTPAVGDPDAPVVTASTDAQEATSTGRPVDAGGHEAATIDAARDVASCNSSSCDGCCTAQGLCAAGGLASACGMGGAACQNCAASGLACVSGACAQPPADAGTSSSACNATTCANLCVPYFIQCCKTDQTCGCALLFPRGTCN